MYHRCMVFSRYDRDALVAVINRYLSDDLTAFRLDDALSDLSARTKDQTVKHVADLFWYHYDDIEDHKVIASKEEWDFFQRLLLILKSDADIVEETGGRKWTARQAVAAACLAVFAVVLAKTGWGSHLFLATVPLGGVSVLLKLWQSSLEETQLRQQVRLVPFGSMSEMRSVRRKVQGFVKSRYPTRLGSRQIHGPVSEAFNWLHFAVVWLLFSPVALLVQALPEREQRWKVAGT
ncbi:MAG: hypothetical protein WCK27_27105 [Verrucomicrobiota bacterium]